jgi:hypothetical protein
VSGEILSELLNTIENNRAFSGAACNSLIAKLDPLLRRFVAMPIGPQFKIRHRAAMHVWEFNQCEIGTWKL